MTKTGKQSGKWINAFCRVTDLSHPFRKIFRFFIFIFKIQESWEQFHILAACVQAVLEDILAMSSKQHALVPGKC